MKILRESTIKLILAKLDMSIFTRHAFDCKFNADEGVTVSIKYIDEPMYAFIITQDEWGSHWNVSECPGFMFTDEETARVNNFEDATDKIEAWIQRIIEDFSISGATNHIDFSKMRESLDRTADSLTEPHKPFSFDESHDWKNKLDKLVEKFEKLEQDNEIQQEELTKLRSEVAILKDNVHSTPKKIWVKSAGNKIIQILERVANTESGKLLLEKTIKLLLGSDNG